MALTEKEQAEGIKRIKEGFEDVESLMTTLKKDLESADRDTHLSAIFISVEFVKMVAKFTNEVKRLSELKAPIAIPSSSGLYIPPANR